MSSDIQLDDCIWVRSKNGEIPPFRPLMRSLEQRGQVVSLDIATAADLQRFREQIWK